MKFNHCRKQVGLKKNSDSFGCVLTNFDNSIFFIHLEIDSIYYELSESHNDVFFAIKTDFETEFLPPMTMKKSLVKIPNRE